MAVNSWDLPGVGKMDRRLALGIGGAAVAVVGLGYWRRRDTGSDTGVEAAQDVGDFGEGAAIPGVVGAVSPTNLYGEGSGGDTTAGTDAYGFAGTTNAQWTQYTSQQLGQAEAWPYADVVTALGGYLAGAPLSTLQKRIVQAAIALGGAPPVGNHVIVSGGDTALTVAPSGLAVRAVSASSVDLTYNEVPGAAGYLAFRRGASTSVGTATGTSLVVSGLEPATTYEFSVAAVNGSGAQGPKSGPKTTKTKGVTLGVPTKPRVSAITRSTAHVTTTPVKNADGYDWYLNGVAHGHSDGPAYTLSGLLRHKLYRVSVSADTSTGAPGKRSAFTPFRAR
jgi:Fibronectin type III domain